MAKATEKNAHAELVGGGETTLHSHAGGGGVSIKIKAETRAMNAASGDVSYTGYGFQPSGLIIIATNGGVLFSVGFGDTSLAELVIGKRETNWVPSGTRIVWLLNESNLGQTAVLKTLDADGFTLTWTLDAGLGGTGFLYVMALK